MIDEDRRAALSRVLTWGLAIALLVSSVAVVYVAVTPQETTDPYTEFYLLGPGGNASDYPTQLAPGGTGEVIVGVSNHEHEPMTYHVVVTWNGTETQRLRLSVPDEATRERRLTLTAPGESGRYRVRFLLYHGPVTEGAPDDFLRLWVRVGEGTTNASTETSATVAG